MRTVDTEAAIADQHTLIVPVPADVRPGSYRVVVVIEAPAVDEAMATDGVGTAEAWSALRQLGQELAQTWPPGVQSADVLSAMRDER